LLEVESKNLFRNRGFSSIYDFADELIEMDRRKTQYLLSIARRLEALPAIAAAFDSGEIGWTKGPTKNNYPFWDADASRLAALLVGHISRYYSLLAPCQTGASAPENGHLFLAGP
jgi:hypothetical protein